MSYPSHHLSFDLPKAFGLVPTGRHQPCLHGCVLEVRGLHVSLKGPTKESVVDQALRFVRVHARGGLKTAPIEVTIAGPEGRSRGSITVDETGVWWARGAIAA